MNPYQVLGVSTSATKEEIHDAYRQLVKKNHPDKFTDPKMNKIAEEKIKQINEAYDLLKSGNYNPNSGAGAGSPFDNYGSRGGNYNSYTTSTGSAEFAHIREMINRGDIQGAIAELNRSNNRNAEWNYLMGVAMLRSGRYDAAREHLGRATNMEPGNYEYAQAYASLLNFGGRYQTKTYQKSRTGCCDCCSTMLCLNCLCGGIDGNCCTCCC